MPPAPALLPATQRWTSLFISMAQLNAEYHDSQVSNNISELTRPFLSLLYSIQMRYKPSHTGVIFNVINQHHIRSRLDAADAAPLRTLQSTPLRAGRGGLGDAAEHERADLVQNLELNMELYTRECLNSHARNMCEYVRQVGVQMKGEWLEGTPVPGLGPDKAKVCAQLSPIC